MLYNQIYYENIDVHLCFRDVPLLQLWICLNCISNAKDYTAHLSMDRLCQEYDCSIGQMIEQLDTLVCHKYIRYTLSGDALIVQINAALHASKQDNYAN